MARTVSTIYNSIVANYVANAAAVGITINPAAWSMYNLQRLMLYTAAAASAIFEQIMDVFVADIEAVVAVASPQTAPWIQNLCLNVFQFDATTPQIPALDNVGSTYAPYYPVVDVTKRILTQCVVVPGMFGTTRVKVAGAGGAISGGALSALQSFLNITTVPGINVNASSGDADRIYLNGTVTYTGTYSAVIQANVVAAIQAFFASIPTSGVVTGVNSPAGLMRLTDLIAAVRAVPGVIDFELTNINARPNGTSFVPGSYNLVSASDWINTQWQSGLNGSGYMIVEDTAAVGTDGVTALIYSTP